MFLVARSCLVPRRKLTSRNASSFQKCWAPHSLMGGKRSTDLAISRSRTTGFLSMLIGIGEGLTSLLILWPLSYKAGSRLLPNRVTHSNATNLSRRWPCEGGRTQRQIFQQKVTAQPETTNQPRMDANEREFKKQINSRLDGTPFQFRLAHAR